MQYFIYILASGRNGTLYIGVTNDIVKRVWEHKNSLGSIFTTQHGVHQLVYVETADDALSAIQRENNLKSGSGRGRLS